jgi:NAD(P)H dehydrogenase (quinone)
MNVFIVFAHPEAKSFGRALLDRSVRVLQEGGHQVAVSDLYAMNFNPLASAADFHSRRFPHALQYDREQKHAHHHHAFAQDIQDEIDKLLACDMLILQFPLWWFSVPAMMKGWIDRVFVNGVVYGKGRRFDTGGLKGRRAMVCTTTACHAEMAEHDGLLGHLNINLWHLQHGTLGYAGFEVLEPFAAWSIQYTTPEHRQAYLDAYARRLAAIEREAPLPAHALSDFGADWKLKPDIEPRTVGHRRAGVLG